MIANKKFQILTILILVAFVIFSAVAFLTQKPKLTGFVAYDPGSSACPQEITSSGTYSRNVNVLCNDGDNGIIITSSDVILDCQGHTIGKNTGTPHDGIKVDLGLTNITINNCTIDSFDYGMRLSSDAVVISNTTITNQGTLCLAGTYNASYVDAGCNAGCLPTTGVCSAGAVNDTTSPVVHSILPENNLKTNETTQNLSCSITDNLGISNLTLYIWNSSGYLNYSNTATLNGTANSTNWTRTLSTNDAYIWNCLGYDNSTNNNLAWSSDGNYTLTIDTISPKITIISPLNQTYNTTVIYFNVSLNESGSWCGYSLDGFENVSMTFNASNTGASATNSTMSQGSHNVKFSCNDTAGNMNATSSKRYFTISSGPTIDFGLKTTAVGNYSQTWIAVNITSNDTDLDKITIYIYNQTVLHNSTFSSESSFFVNFTSLAEGTYYINATANDSINNLNITSTKKIILDRTAPTPTLTCTPTSVAPNEVVTCTCSATDSLSGVDTSTYIYTASPPTNLEGALTTECYVNDTAGNNGSTSTSYTVTAGGGGGGGGGSCTPNCAGKTCGSNGCGGSCGTCLANQTCSSGQCVNTLLDITCTEDWTCGNWTACINGIKTQTCTDSNSCGTEISKPATTMTCITNCTENFVCGNWTDCVDSQQSRTCTDSNSCSAEIRTETRECEIRTETEEIPETTEPPARPFFSSSGNGTINIPRPSDIIPHGDVPAIVIDTAVYTTAAAVVIGGFQLAWLWILGLLIPLFLLRLRHYCVAIIDTNLELPFVETIISHEGKVMQKSLKVKKEKIIEFIQLLSKNLGEKIIYAEQLGNFYRFVFEKGGFLELQIDIPLILNAHFSSGRKSRKFYKALKLSLTTLLKDKGKKDIELIMKSVYLTSETSSIFASLRSINRAKKLRKLNSKFNRKQAK